MNQNTELLLVRHGNTFASSDVVCRVGTTDLPLVESGLKQAENLGYYLKQENLIPDLIFTSELQRTRQTAMKIQQILGLDLPMHALAMLNEIDYGPDENQPESAVIARIGEATLADWDSHAIVPPGWHFDPQKAIEEWLAFAQEIETKYAGKRILVVSSNGILRFAPYISGDFEAFRQNHAIKISTGALCQFSKSKGASHWICHLWNQRP